MICWCQNISFDKKNVYVQCARLCKSIKTSTWNLQARKIDLRVWNRTTTNCYKKKSVISRHTDRSFYDSWRFIFLFGRLSVSLTLVYIIFLGSHWLGRNTCVHACAYAINIFLCFNSDFSNSAHTAQHRVERVIGSVRPHLFLRFPRTHRVAQSV